MKRAAYAFLAMCLGTTLWGQTDRSSLDSLFWVPLPADSIVLEHACWVERHGPLATDSAVGLLRWSEHDWAWQADTALDVWSIRWGAKAQVWSVDLGSKAGRVDGMLEPPAGMAWSVTREEGKHEGQRYRVFESGGDRLHVIAAGALPTPSAERMVEWHLASGANTRTLEPLPGRVVPVEYAPAAAGGWRLKGCRNEQRVLNLREVWAFDPNRSLMDVVRERKATEEGQR